MATRKKSRLWITRIWWVILESSAHFISIDIDLCPTAHKLNLLVGSGNIKTIWMMNVLMFAMMWIFHCEPKDPNVPWQLWKTDDEQIVDICYLTHSVWPLSFLNDYWTMVPFHTIIYNGKANKTAKNHVNVGISSIYSIWLKWKFLFIPKATLSIYCSIRVYLLFWRIIESYSMLSFRRECIRKIEALLYNWY